MISEKGEGTKFKYFPGGKREQGETDLACLKREICEELNVDIVDNSIQFFGIFKAVADGRE